MAFFKRTRMKTNGKWYPQSITVGKPVTTAEVAKTISAQCTVNPADVNAVLTALGGVLGDFMKHGLTVKLDGVGTFYYTANSRGNGVDNKEDVTATQITNVRVRFIPETHLSSSRKVTSRALVNDSISWDEWGKESSAEKEEGGDGGEVIDPME
ncbi:HU family DNA-binding protein [Bacteroides sp.]